MPFKTDALIFIALYLCSLILIGYKAYRSRQSNTLADHYLAGRGFGLVVLVLTLFATQYSGNTMLGFSGKTYRIGFAWVSAIHFMTFIIVFYLIFAPKLYRLSREHGFITPADYIAHRFRLPSLSTLASLIMVVALSNFLLAQLMAMGRALEGLIPNHPDEAYTYGVIFLALIMVIYESLGGLRAVAWTDMIQGGILITGFTLLIIMVLNTFGSLGGSVEKVLATQPEKITPPSPIRVNEWMSYILMVGLGGALYPQAIQRIYAARGEETLRRSFAIMAFFPLLAVVAAIIVGIVSLAEFPGLQGAEADRVLTLMMARVQAGSTLGYWLVAVLFAGLLAAIMSTADSALLSISSMLTKDIYRGWIDREASEENLTRLGKIFSWAVISLMVVFALALRDTTLVKLLDRKFDILIQLVPAFFIGIHWKKMHPAATLAGVGVGLAIALGFAFSGHGKIAGFHAGLFGLVANLAIAVAGSKLVSRPSSP